MIILIDPLSLGDKVTNIDPVFKYWYMEKTRLQYTSHAEDEPHMVQLEN